MIYDPRANMISWDESKGENRHAKELGNMIIHVSKSGKPILIAILDASSFISQFDKHKIIKDIKKVLPV